MKDEIWMRTWVDGHDGLSADIDRGFARLGHALRRLGQWIAPAGRSGINSFFARAAVRCGLRAASN